MGLGWEMGNWSNGKLGSFGSLGWDGGFIGGLAGTRVNSLFSFPFLSTGQHCGGSSRTHNIAQNKIHTLLCIRSSCLLLDVRCVVQGSRLHDGTPTLVSISGLGRVELRRRGRNRPGTGTATPIKQGARRRQAGHASPAPPPPTHLQLQARALRSTVTLAHPTPGFHDCLLRTLKPSPLPQGNNLGQSRDSVIEINGNANVTPQCCLHQPTRRRVHSFGR